MPGETERDAARQARFEREMLPHMDAAYNLARWLLREGSALRPWQRCLLYAAYGLHLAGGIAYYIYVFISPHYG